MPIQGYNFMINFPTALGLSVVQALATLALISSAYELTMAVTMIIII